MAGGQQIDSGQGSVVQSADVVLTGAEVAVQDGTIVANTPADVAATGVEATIASGTTAPSAFAFLRSRKVGGGSASRALTGSAITASPGALLMSATKTPTGASITASSGTLGRSRTRALTGASSTAATGSMIANGQTSIFPLSIHSSGRYLATAQGDGFLIHGDTPWSIPAQLTNAEIDTYIADRAARGFTSILIEAIVRTFTSQTPDYRTVDGLDPFTTMTDFSSPNNAYWNRVDYIVNACKAQNMVVMMNPAYLGFNGGAEGWMVQVNAASAASLQAYGVFLANRYTQGNIIWCMGGDYAGTVTERNKQWNIVTGMRTVRTTDIITAHGAPGDQAYTSWTGYTGFNLNNAYPRSNDVYTYCLTEYGRAGPTPFFMIEGWYEGEPDPPQSAQRIRLQAYQSLLSGACGHFYGNNPIWHFESPNTLYPYTGTWESNLNSTGAQDMQRVKTLFDSYQWELLQPKTDTSLVTSALGTGDNRICPARASDASFALIYIPTSSTVTVNMAALTVGSVRARLYDPTNGVYTTVSGSPFAPSGTQVIASGGERVLVLDADPVVINFMAASPSQADVTSALALASPGQVVGIPAGTATWSTNLSVPNGVILRGAGGGWIQGTSSTSVAIGTASGQRTFTIRASTKLATGTSAIFGFTVGEQINCRVKYNASQYITGTVASWNGTTLVVNVTAVSGSGTYTRWNFQKRGATQITRSGGTITLGTHATYDTALTDVEITNATGAGNEMINLDAANASNAPTQLCRVQIIVSTRFSGSNSRMVHAASKGWLITRCSFACDGFNWGVLGPAPTYGIKSFITGATPTIEWRTRSYWGADDLDGKRNAYIEDCYFAGGSSEIYDFDGGSRVVIRQSVQDNASGGSHGADTSNESVRQFEMYNCLLCWEDNGSNNNTCATDTYFYHRGGPAVWTDCEVDDINSSQWGNKGQWRYTIQNVRRNAGPYACWTTYPVPQQIGQGCADGGAYLTDGFYYWNLTGTGNFPVADDYTTDDCGNGLTTATFVQAGRDIFNSAKPGYTKYTYPHPLRVD